MFIQQNVLQLEISMNARLAVDIGYRSDKLSEYPFHFLDGEWAVAEKVIIEFIAYAQKPTISSCVSHHAAIRNRNQPIEHTRTEFQYKPD